MSNKEFDVIAPPTRTKPKPHDVPPGGPNYTLSIDLRPHWTNFILRQPSDAT